MSQTYNIIANYIGLFYMTVLGIVMVPVYLSYLGAEAYGLIGFFGVLTGWLQLLDLGLRNTLARETAVFNAGAMNVREFRQLLRSVNGVFFIVGAVMMLGIAACSALIAQKWLHIESLDITQVTWAVALMGVTIGLQWLSGPYRSVVLGLEHQVWLNVYLMIAATIRYVGTVAAFLILGATPKVLFGFHTLIAMIEFLILRATVNRWLPPTGRLDSWSLAPFKRIWGFTTIIALSSVIWVCVTQTDKLILSKLLPLSEYAYFSVAIMAAGGITLIQSPIFQAIQPGLTRLFAKGDEFAFLSIYEETTQLIAALTFSIGTILALYAHPILRAWTGNEILANAAAPVMAYYVWGNVLLAIMTVPYIIQYAKGDLSLHWRGTVLYGIIIIPLVIIMTSRFGMIGAGAVWFGTNLAFLLFWTPIVHRRFVPGLHFRWLVKDVIWPGLISAIPAMGGMLVPWQACSRTMTLAIFVSLGVVCTTFGCLLTKQGRRAAAKLYISWNLKTTVDSNL